ncbi:MAG: hypothetical protein DI538_16005 [Azospira oryzae]|jgi:AcrR family transcriptional regulator|nr:hypothetical protein [Cytophaga sp.]PZR34858.1 MAG: hypothetical protein DI538_16005 [Azospira oryzae]
MVDIPVLNKDEIIRAEIILSARELFQRFGLLKTTMEDIARAAGKGKSTLYYYYTSKDEIFEAVIQEDMAEVFVQVKKAVEKATTAELKLKAFTLTRLKLLNQRIALFNIVCGEINDNPALIRKNKKVYEAQELELLRSILHFGVQKGEFRKMEKEDVDNLSFVMLSALRGIERSLLEDSQMKKMTDRMDLILNILANGIKKK